MSKADKKQRQRLKRKSKHHESRRRQSVSPIKRLADSPGEIECWMSEDFETLGQSQIFVYKRVGSLAGIACFLVDIGVVGLKDAWTQLNVIHDDLEDFLDASADQGIAMRRVSLDAARSLIAGGIRWAHEHGMRLPADWTKTVSLIGGVEGWEEADVSRFAREFAGHPEDLRQRLIGESFDDFIQRKDVAFQFLDDAPFKDQSTGEYLNDDASDYDDQMDDPIDPDAADELVDAMLRRFSPAAEQLATQTAAWLAKRNETPSPELIDAWKAVMVARVLTNSALTATSGAQGDLVEDRGDLAADILDDLGNGVEDSRFYDWSIATNQVVEHLNTDPPMMQKAILTYGLLDDESTLSAE